MRRGAFRFGLVLAALLLLWSQVASAFMYHPPTPSGTIGVSRPQIAQKLDLQPGDRIAYAEMWLDGKRVYPKWDAAGMVSYQPAKPLEPGLHEVQLTVRVIPADPDAFYDPLQSSFSFTVAAGAVADLPAPGPEELRALDRVNQYRALAGLAPLVYDPRLAAAARSHASYLMRNPAQIEIDAHRERPGTPGFLAESGGERVRYFAYPGGFAEVINFVARAEDAVDSWIDTLYHRIPLLHPGMSDMGYGLAAGFTQRLNVIEAGPFGMAEGIVAWPYPGQPDVPPLWDGAESPDPLALYPGVAGPVGYPITLTFGGEVRRLSMTRGTLTGPEGEVPVLPFDPVNDSQLEDTVALIPVEPLRPGVTYSVRITGQVDLGTGPKGFDQAWSFTTASEYRPVLVSRAATASLRSIRVDGAYFGPGLRLFLDGLPVQGLQLLSADRLTFQPPVGYQGGVSDLLVVTPSGAEQVWYQFFDGTERYRATDGPPFATLPVTVRGIRLTQPALVHVGGTLMLPEEALVKLGGTVERVDSIGRAYWRVGERSGEYTKGHLRASVDAAPLLLALPVRSQGAITYVDAAFAQALGDLQVLVVEGQAYLSRPVLGILDIDGHWALPQVQRLLEAGIVSGYGDGSFRPEAPLSRAAFIKMLVQARGLSPRPGETGGLTGVDHWVSAQGYLGAALAAGILQAGEYPHTGFEPDRLITREEMAVLVTRALGLEQRAQTRQIPVVGGAATIGARRFTDASQWTRPGHIAVAVEAGIITGYAEDGGGYTYRPTRPATRAEAAVMVARLIDLIP